MTRATAAFCALITVTVAGGTFVIFHKTISGVGVSSTLYREIERGLFGWDYTFRKYEFVFDGEIERPVLVDSGDKVRNRDLAFEILACLFIGAIASGGVVRLITIVRLARDSPTSKAESESEGQGMSTRQLWLRAWLLMAVMAAFMYARSFGWSDACGHSRVLVASEGGSINIVSPYTGPLTGWSSYRFRSPMSPIAGYRLEDSLSGIADCHNFYLSWLLFATAFAITGLWPYGRSLLRSRKAAGAREGTAEPFVVHEGTRKTRQNKTE